VLLTSESGRNKYGIFCDVIRERNLIKMVSRSVHSCGVIRSIKPSRSPRLAICQTIQLPVGPIFQTELATHEIVPWRTAPVHDRQNSTWVYSSRIHFPIPRLAPGISDGPYKAVVQGGRTLSFSIAMLHKFFLTIAVALLILGQGTEAVPQVYRTPSLVSRY
jgi:hypothetical protein